MKYSKDEIIKATKDSLENWNNNLKIIKEHKIHDLNDEPLEELNGYGIKLGQGDCPLCTLFNKRGWYYMFKSPCIGCPLYEVGYGCLLWAYVGSKVPKVLDRESPYDKVIASYSHEQLVKNTEDFIKALELALKHAESKE